MKRPRSHLSSECTRRQGVISRVSVSLNMCTGGAPKLCMTRPALTRERELTGNNEARLLTAAIAIAAGGRRLATRNCSPIAAANKEVLDAHSGLGDFDDRGRFQ